MTMRGTGEPSAILGLCSYTHDSAAALIVNGHLRGFAEEERLAGDKHTKEYPAHAIAWLLADNDLTPEQVTAVSYNFQAHRYLGALVQPLGQLFQPASRRRILPRVRNFARGKIVESGLFDEVHVPPAPGDSGTAIGGAAAVHLVRFGSLPSGVTDRCYLGPAHPDLMLSESPRPGLSAHRPAASARFLARHLADGHIVGVFNGQLEAGPRALGNRSILASPLLPDVVDRLNATVKFREPFRPFAPIVLADVARDYFTLPQQAPYMSIASGVTELAQDTIPAVVHANDTARVQTVTADRNPFLAEVLTEFAALTGAPVLINTSLNVKGKPICGTPEMALDCLVDSGLDALMIEGWWVSK